MKRIKHIKLDYQGKYIMGLIDLKTVRASTIKNIKYNQMRKQINIFLNELNIYFINYYVLIIINKL